MSRRLGSSDGVTVVQFCGAERPDGGDRRLVAVTNHNTGESLTLPFSLWLRLMVQTVANVTQGTEQED